MFRFAADFDDEVGICELGDGNVAGNIARRLIIGVDESLQILDRQGDQIASAGAGYVANSTDYWILWYVDLREEANSRDILWVWKAGAWDKAIDVSGHGDGDHNDITAITFGTSQGKGLPTVGGPFYVDEMASQYLNVSPNTTPLGSITTVFKVPSANGTDTDFDGGAPNFQDVDEIPPDQVAIDQGDANGEKSSYKINDAAGGDTPLAVQVIGSAQRGGGAIDIRTYVLETGVGTRDYGDDFSQLAGYRALGRQTALAKTYNQINGKTITESTSDGSNASFNDLEAGVEGRALLSGADTIDLDQIGLEYLKEGPKALPDDFPTMGIHTITGEASGAGLGSANPTIW
jgi:hypothetical protein